MSENNVMDRSAVEDFLYLECDLLDQWRLDEWFALFAPDARYEIPPTGAADDASAKDSLFFVADNYVRLKHRVERLKNKNAHSEFPRSRVFRMVSNVRLLSDGGEQVECACKFMTMRSRDDITDTYFGHQLYTLTRIDGQIRILRKRTMLDCSSLRPQGRVSIIL